MRAEAQLSLQQRFRIAKARSLRLLQKYDDSEPRDDSGKWTSGGGGGDSSGGFTIAPPPAPLDRDGKPLVDLDDKRVERDVNGKLVLYQRTTDAAAQQIKESGYGTTGETYFSTHETGYANGAGDSLVKVRVYPKLVRMIDARHDGEVHVAVKNEDLKPSSIEDVQGSEVIAYHGTTAEVAKQIAKDGLQVRRGKTYAKDTNTDGSDHYLGERGQSVYITNDRGEAMRFASGRAWKLKDQKKREPDIVVFKMKMPRTEWEKLKSDEEHDHAKRAPSIPPKYFSEYRIYHDASRWKEDTDREVYDPDNYELAKIVELKAANDDVTLFMSFIVDDPASAKKSALQQWQRACGRELLTRYSPDEPRDDAGKWTSGGGGGDAAEAEPPKKDDTLWSGSGPATLEVTGFYDDQSGKRNPIMLEVQSRTSSKETAEQLAAQFPKSAGLRAIAGYQNKYGLVHKRIILTPNKTTGEKNDAGIRRYKSILNSATRLGHSVVYTKTHTSNAYDSADELHAAAGIDAKPPPRKDKAYDPSEPRDPDGKWSGGGAGSEGESKPGGGGGKKSAKKEDFDKAKVTLPPDKAAQDAFIEKWNDKVGVDPATFKSNFMGGLDGPMRLSATGNQINVNGEVHDSDGKALGNFERNINLDSKSAYSAYFKLNKSSTKHDIGKKMLAGNIDTYKKLGIEKVSVTANIDVGGYAWAKYGYVPTQSAWNDLRGSLERKLTGGGSSSSSSRVSSGNEADDWDQLSSDQQDDVRDEWMRQTRDEFVSSEEQNWRDSGQAKDDAKRELANDFTNYQVTDAGVPEWVGEALDEVRSAHEENGDAPIPYTNRQIYDAVELSYESRNGDGEDDPDIGFDDKMLQQPAGYDPAQGTLPGIEPIDPATRLTDTMRDEISASLTSAFNKKADDDADELDPPSYLAENVSEYQDEYWSSMSERDMLQHAIDYNMADIPVEPDEEEEPQAEMDLPKTDTDPLLAAVKSSDPKSIWKVADSPRGKDLLLGTGWSGVLNLKDKDQMDRFNKYVGKAA